MLTELEKVEALENCSKMQSLCSATHLQELIKSFDSKSNQQKDVSQVKSGKPAKMKLRDAREVLEITRLKVLASEMREKVVKLESQLLEATKQSDKSDAKSKIVDNKAKDLQESMKNEVCMDVKDINNQNLSDRQGHNVGNHMSSPGVKQEMCMLSMTKKSMDLLKEQDAKLDKDMAELRAHIKNLQCDVDGMLLELPQKLCLQKELTSTKERLKGLQEEIKDDAGLTKAQLLLLKKQFGELEEIEIANDRKEQECRKASQLLNTLEAEVKELRYGNKELLKHKEELNKRLVKALKKAEEITPITKDDVLAAQAEVSTLKSTNTELQKKMESLQLSRFNEVEEVVYLRWVNACLRHDLDTYTASRRNSEDISEQSNNKSIPSLHDLVSCTTSGHSFTSYSDAHGLHASQNDDDDDDDGSTVSFGSTTKSSRQIAIPHGHMSSSHSSPISIKQGHFNTSHVSPLTNIHSHVNSSHPSPLSIPHGHVNSSHSSPRSTTHASPRSMTHAHVNSIHTSSPLPIMHGHVKNSNISPLPIGELQSRLSYSAKSNPESSMTTSTSRTQRRSGISFNRSASSISSYSDASINRMQSSPQMQDMKGFMRSSSALSSNSDISISSHSSIYAIPGQQHSASSGMSILDEYLHSTDVRGLNRPTSRFSAVLPYDRQFSDSASVPFPTITEGPEPPKRKENKNMKAHSFESHLDASDRVVSAFQALSASSQKTAHRTFKDVSRQNQCDDKTADKVDDQATHEHKPLYNTHVDSKGNGMSRDSEHSQSIARSSQAEFFCDLARAIQVTHYRSIDKVAAFVNWFDRQGDVEKQEFFSFPDCPKDKLEAMRRAVHEYEELQALENELTSYKDDLRTPTDLALKDMENLLEKVEDHIQGFKQARELAIAQFTELHIPTYWMLDSEMIAKIKGASLKVAQEYIHRVLKATQGHQTEAGKTSRDDILLQSARFLLRIHNFAGGFDENTLKAFRMLQSQGGLHDTLNNNVE